MFLYRIVMNKRCVIVSAADIKNYEKIKTFLKEGDFFIFCDGGMKHAIPLGIKPSLFVGDLDSYEENKNTKKLLVKKEVIVLPKEKDDTDTFFAIKEGIKRGFKDFLLLGVIGNRFDHSLCNISALLYLEENGCNGTIIDDYSKMSLCNKNRSGLISSSFSYFSIMNICGDVKGVTIKGAKYPLFNQDIKASYSYGISNEVIDNEAIVTVTDGILLLVKVW